MILAQVNLFYTVTPDWDESLCFISLAQGLCLTTFYTNSSLRVYSEMCFQVQDMLGEPIKAFGEESRRGRRNRVSHLVYQVYLLLYTGGMLKKGRVL